MSLLDMVLEEAEKPKPEKPRPSKEEVEKQLLERLKPKEEKEEEVRPSEMIRIYMLSFKFPSENLVVKTRMRWDEKYVYQTGEADRKKYNRLRQLRTRFEYLKRKFMYQSDFGWFAFSEEGVNEAKKVLAEAIEVVKEVRPDKTNDYVVDAIEVYLKPEDARKLLESAKRRLEEDLSDIEEKMIRYEEERKRRMVSMLRYQYKQLSQKLNALVKELRKIQIQ